MIGLQISHKFTEKWGGGNANNKKNVQKRNIMNKTQMKQNT